MRAEAATEGQEGEEWTSMGGRRGYQKGTTIHYIRVIGQHVREGKYAAYTNRQYRVECIAPTGKNGAECGKKGLATYHQLYYGTLYSCGCVKKPRHPPVKLEGQLIGRVDVLRWTEEHGGMWELVCQECGELIYRKTVAQVRAAGESCHSHKKPVA